MSDVATRWDTPSELDNSLYSDVGASAPDVAVAGTRGQSTGRLCS